MNITNNSKSPIGIPGNVVLEPGETRFILNWHEVQDNRIIQAWLSRGTLTVEARGEVPAKPSAVSEDVEKDALIARLKEHGINRNKRASVDKLRELLAEAEAEAQAGDAEE